ncbi:histone deacetylase complex protein [Rhizoctonia solani AG-1 IA]|uniref:histone deacetylase n=1 Tax=Thanatephorus cucumeris (strain AG1-IA) TaxID=983506 RepID=L8WVU7_THACA|nr:histone deacetylase complex protein [Rhizoctonia solani AG-1 IA]
MAKRQPAGYCLFVINNHGSAPPSPVTLPPPSDNIIAMDVPATSSSQTQEPVPYHHLRTGYCYDSAMTMHTQHGVDPDDPESEHHPEKPQRITCIRAILANNRLLERMHQIPIRQVRTNEVMLVHTRDLVDKVAGLERSIAMTNEHITQTAQFYEQLSLYVTQATSQAAALSCGGVIECALAVARGQVRNSFAIVRPPGHHAEPDEHMGFCFYNNVAVATRVVFNETPVKRVLILDWDVHHGNGTQLAFEDDPNVLYISIHRYDGGEFYPGGTYGSMNSVGLGAGKGKSVNIPWPEGHMGDADYMYAFLNIVMPIAYEFAPELVFSTLFYSLAPSIKCSSNLIVSAGFDAAAGDTLGNCEVTPECYAHMTALLSTLAGGKLVVALEGGYNLDSIAKSALAVTRALLGDPLPELPRLDASEIATEVVWQVARIQSQYWHCIQASSLEPSDTIDETTIHLPELFKAWRREHALKDFGLYEFPWAIPELDESYNGQLLVSENISTQHTLVMFVHDFGNISTELLTMKQLNIELENAWIIDTTRDFLKWCKSQQFSVIDLNMHPLIRRNEELPSEKERQETAKQAVISAWDNLAEYVYRQWSSQLIILTGPDRLSDAREIVIVAHGSAGLSVMGLIDERCESNLDCRQGCSPGVWDTYDPFRSQVPKRTEKVITLYTSQIRKSNESMGRSSNQVCPSSVLSSCSLPDQTSPRSAEERVTKVMRTSLPLIQQFITDRVTPRSLLIEGTRKRAVPAPAPAPVPPSETAANHSRGSSQPVDPLNRASTVSPSVMFIAKETLVGFHTPDLHEDQKRTIGLVESARLPSIVTLAIEDLLCLRICDGPLRPTGRLTEAY